MKFAVRKRRAPIIIIVSLVDILIILLIFFVVSTTFKKDQPEVQINLPESKTAQKQPSEVEHAIVSIDQNDEIKLDGSEVDPKSSMPLVLINPKIELHGEIEMGVEGCLSFPEITGEIERAESVIVRAQNLEGEVVQFEAGGFLARAIQHEHDHLNGILFIDRMRSAAKAALSSRLKRLQKESRRTGRPDLQEAQISL